MSRHVGVPPHTCGSVPRKHIATEQSPYRFTQSGLDNVYLTGIPVYTCECGNVAAEIPALTELLDAIATAVVGKSAPLIGREVAFLRKRVGKPAKQFAEYVGVIPTHYSTIENGGLVQHKHDVVIRLLYDFFKKDKKTHDRMEKTSEEWLTSSQRDGFKERIIARRRKTGWAIKTEECAA